MIPSQQTFKHSSKKDEFESPDFYQLDDLFTDEQLMIRSAVRDFVKKEISPIIEDAAQRCEFPEFIVKLDTVASWFNTTA